MHANSDIDVSRSNAEAISVGALSRQQYRDGTNAFHDMIVRVASSVAMRAYGGATADAAYCAARAASVSDHVVRPSEVSVQSGNIFLIQKLNTSER